MADHPIVVVGAGPAGIAAAFGLQQAGHRVRILEAASKVGGKMQTTERDGLKIDRGPTAISDRYRNVLGIVADAGLSDELTYGGNVVGFPRPGEMHYLDCDRLFSGAIRTGLLSPRSKLMMAKVFLDNRRLFKRLSYEDLSIACDEDVESAADYALRRLNPELGEYIVDCTVRGVLGTRAHEVSVLDFFFAFNNVIGGPRPVAPRFPGQFPLLLPGIDQRRAGPTAGGHARVLHPGALDGGGPPARDHHRPQNRAPEQVPEGKGFVTIYAASHHAKRLIDQAEDAIITDLLNAGESLLGPLRGVEWIEIDRHRNRGWGAGRPRPRRRLGRATSA